MSTVAILGGGVSGLSCAYYLKTLGKSKIKYLFLLEKGPRFGGWIQTTKFPDGAVYEHGPRTLRVAGAAGYNSIELVDKLGLGSQIIPIRSDHPGSKKRFVLAKNKLHLLPNGLRYLYRAIPPFQKPLFSCLMKDLSIRKGAEGDESVYDFGCRHFGKEVADYVFDPLCRGVCANDAKDTSVRSLMPAFFTYDQECGSILKGMVQSARKRVNLSKFLDSSVVFNARQQRWRMWTLRGGLSDLSDALAVNVEEPGHADLHFNAECTKLKFDGGKAVVTVDGDDIEVDHVFSGIPSPNLAALLPDSYDELARHLKSVSFVTLATVNLEFNRFVIGEEGFGFLTPSFEDAKVLGIVFDSSCVPQHNGFSRTRITCMLGGKWFNELFGAVDTVTKQQVLKIAVEETRRLLRIEDPPARFHVSIQKDCMPHYAVGHYKKLESMNNEIKRNNLCLSLIGASYEAAGVPDCIYNSRLSVERYLEGL